MDVAERQLALAEHFVEIGQPRRALEALDRLAGADLEDPHVWFLRGQALYDLEQYQEASRAAQAGLARFPDAVPLLYLQCNAEAELGNLAAAEQAILAALRLVPEDPDLLSRYALLVAQAGQLDKAERLLDEAARIDPDAGSVTRARVLLSYVRGDNRELGQFSQKLLADDPDDPYGHRMLGIAMAARGHFGKAAHHFQGAARLDPTHTGTAEAARDLTLQTHWMLWPLWPFSRFGPGPVWLVAIVTIFSLSALGFETASVVFALAYMILCVYSWVVPPLLRRWLRWRNH